MKLTDMFSILSKSESYLKYYHLITACIITTSTLLMEVIIVAYYPLVLTVVGTCLNSMTFESSVDPYLEILNHDQNYIKETIIYRFSPSSHIYFKNSIPHDFIREAP